MFHTIEKLDELEKVITENLMKADNHTWSDDSNLHWRNYRKDMPSCLAVIREYKKLIEDLKLGNR